MQPDLDRGLLVRIIIFPGVGMGMKIGMKITMISVHSSGQPKMKMMNWARIMNWIGVRSMDSTHFSTSS
jgi:hypothetical protein